MTTLTIYPKFGDKTAKIIGTVSAGEHVDIRIVGGASLLPSSTLRLRITCGKTIAVFPQPQSNDSWATEGSDLKCHLNLNTVQAEIALRHGCVSCRVILEQTADDEHTLEPTLFFDDEFDVLPWRKIPGETTPFNLDAYPDVIASFERQLTEFGAVVDQTKNLVTQAKNAAVGANNRAGAAEIAAQGAERSALAAQRALDGINGQVEDAQRAASEAGEAAEKASESASASAESAVSAAQYAADAAAAAVNKADLVNGKVPASQLPSYVDDVLEFASASAFPATGETGKIYIAKDTNRQYRWSGTQYVELGGGEGEDVNAVHYYAETKTAAQKAQARANIGAMAADTPIPQVGGKLPAKPLPKYLYELSFDDTYDGDAQAFYNSLSQNPVGGCSAVRKGQKIGRNYDWKYSEAPEFVVRVSSADGRHASVGVASVGSLLTEQMVMSGEYQSLYRVLPGMTLDGINDAHLVCEINVIPRDPSKDPEYDETEGRTMHPLAVVRYALDHFATALEAAQYISAHYYIPENSADSYHWSVSDPTGSYVIEDGTYSFRSEAIVVLTNHRVITMDIYGSGYTRDVLLLKSGTLEEILPQVAYTNAYAEGWPWPDEFAGKEDEDGKIPFDATSRLRAWADEHITPLLDPVTRKPAARGNGCWQTVHSSIYNLTKGTLSIAVQEDFAHRFVFAVGGAKAEVAWDDVSDKPQSFTPSPHAASHGENGADAVTVAQSQVTGLGDALAAKRDKGDFIVGTASGAEWDCYPPVVISGSITQTMEVVWIDDPGGIGLHTPRGWYDGGYGFPTDSQYLGSDPNATRFEYESYNLTRVVALRRPDSILRRSDLIATDSGGNPTIREPFRAAVRRMVVDLLADGGYVRYDGTNLIYTIKEVQ